MDFDRRSALLALSTLLLPGCARAQPPQPPVRIALPSVPPALWALYKTRFLLPEGRIVDDGNGGISHSEGQGYGLLLAATAGDRGAFDTLLGWTRTTLMRKDVPLCSWRYVPGQGVTDPNNATDGDMLIAWACLIAGQRWNDNSCLELSRAIRSAVAERLVVKAHGMTLLLPGLQGFQTDESATINPSYYIWAALDDFARFEPDVWTNVVSDGLKLLRRNRFGPLNLPADWIEVKGDGVVEPAEGRQPLFGFEGIRVPLYMMMSGRKAELKDVARFWNDTIRQNQPIPAFINVITGERAPYGLSPGALSIVSRLTGTPAAPGSGANGDYYSTTLGMLNMMRRGG